MNSLVNTISGRLSLRPPQRRSLEILARVAEISPPTKRGDVIAALEVIRSEFPTVSAFERDFVSLCFALATGVGKTRLMGAFIAYLHRAHGIRHFFVLAPNLTIYEKLVRDFTPNTPKYVLQGLGDFATNPPEVITGDNYEDRGQNRGLFGSVDINIFNISKMNAEVRGGRAPRMKRLSECIGQSYFEYLAGLHDLVLIMDESHRYRADAGVRVLNELQPVLGLELTATPQVERGGKAEPFQNVIYEYKLGQAIADGFVKEPAVSTRADFDATGLPPDELERIKLEDGIILHENTKAQLQVYADQNGLPRVKPFVLVVARDTGHADDLQRIVEQEDFFEGRYKDKVIQVHSNQRGDERDDTVQKLLAIESPDEPTEIVVHVNMLKEGWDVTNLYTIVPLRAANSRTLVEQSIGRGLRLPYGRRTGAAAVDRLTIVAHDHFNEIIEDSKRGDWIILSGVVIGRDVPALPPRAVSVPTVLETLVKPGRVAEAQQAPLAFTTYREQAIASATLEVIQDYQRLPRSEDLRKPEVQAEVVRRVAERLRPAQAAIPGVEDAIDPAPVVARATELFIDKTIDIPRVVVVPSGEASGTYQPFRLDLSAIHFQPVEHDILIQSLRTQARDRIQAPGGFVAETRPEDYVVRRLIEFDDVSYDDHAELLYDLAGQVVTHLRSYLADEDAVTGALQFHQKPLADLVHVQMQAHYETKATAYEGQVTRGFVTLRCTSYTLPRGEAVRDFKAPLEPRAPIASLLFGGFAKCLYTAVRFHSAPEFALAAVLEADPDVLKWVKPGTGVFQIHYAGDSAYEPDFVVEARNEKLICEVKAASEVRDPVVLAKAQAAATWCTYASKHAAAHGTKPWRYALIPHDQIGANRTLSGLLAQYAK